MVTSPLAFLLPKLGLRHWTAQRSARSAELLVGSTPSFSTKTKNFSQRWNMALARLRTSVSLLSRCRPARAKNLFWSGIDLLISC